MPADDREPSPAPKRPNDYDRGDKDRWIGDGRLPEPVATAEADDETQASIRLRARSRSDEEQSRVSADGASDDEPDEDAGDEQERMGDALQAEDARTDGDAARKPEPFGRAAQAVSSGWNGGGGYSDASVERHPPDDARPDGAPSPMSRPSARSKIPPARRGG